MAKLPYRRRAKSPDGTMPLVEHLYELRNRLGIALLAVMITTIVGYIWYDANFFGGPSLGALLKEPYCSLPASSRAVFIVPRRRSSDESRIPPAGTRNK